VTKFKGNIIIGTSVLILMTLLMVGLVLDNKFISILSGLIPLGILAINKPNIMMYIFVIVFPILPDYFRIPVIEKPVYSILSIILIFSFVYRNTVAKNKLNMLEILNDKSFSIVFVWYVGIYCFLYISHNDIGQMIYFLLDSFAIICVFYSAVNSRKTFNKILDVIIATATVIGIFGLIEYKTGFNIFSLLENYKYAVESFGSTPYIRFGQIRIEQSFNHSITYAIYLMFIASIIFYRLQYAKNKIWIYYLALVINVFNEILTMSRGPLIFYFLNIFILFLFMKSRERKKTVLWMLVLIMCLIPLMMVFQFDVFSEAKKVYYMFASLFGYDNMSIISDDFGGNLDPFHYRLALISSILEVSQQNKIIGVGFDAIIQFPYKGPDGIVRMVESIDNNYLYILVRMGVLGIVSLSVYYIGLIIYSFKHRIKKNAQGYDFNLIFGFTMISYILVLFTVAQMHEKRIVWIFIALELIHNKIQKNHNENGSINNESLP